MAEPKKLSRGVDSAAPTAEEENERIAVLRATVYKYLPQFAAAVQKASQTVDEEQRILILHQDAFAAAYDDDEYTLLGMAIKYAGFHGVTVTVVGENHESF